MILVIRQQGIILLNILILITLFSLLLVTQIQGIEEYLESLAKLQKAEQSYNELEQKALDLIQKNKDPPKSCLIDEASPGEIKDRLFKQKGCVLINNKTEYRYLIEDLGIFPCLREMNLKKSMSNATRHLRFNIMLFGEEPKSLQIRIARGIKDEVLCTGVDLSFIKSGIINWVRV